MPISDLSRLANSSPRAYDPFTQGDRAMLRKIIDLADAAGGDDKIAPEDLHVVIAKGTVGDGFHGNLSSAEHRLLGLVRDNGNFSPEAEELLATWIERSPKAPSRMDASVEDRVWAQADDISIRGYDRPTYEQLVAAAGPTGGSGEVKTADVRQAYLNSTVARMFPGAGGKGYKPMAKALLKFVREHKADPSSAPMTPHALRAALQYIAQAFELR